MKDEKKVKATEKVKEEVKTEQNAIPLADKQMEQVAAGWEWTDLADITL